MNADESKTPKQVITACDVKHDGEYVTLEYINKFWRCPTCNKRAFEAHLEPEIN